MTTAFPASLDAFTNPAGSDLQSVGAGGRTHSVMHGDSFDALEAIEAKLGVDGSAVTGSVDYRLRGAPHSRATSTVATTSTTAQTVDVSANPVRIGHTDRVRVSVGGLVVDPSRISVNGGRTTITIAAETISGSTVPFLAGDAIVVEYAGEGA